jgi:hypothetical protein
MIAVQDLAKTQPWRRLKHIVPAAAGILVLVVAALYWTISYTVAPRVSVPQVRDGLTILQDRLSEIQKLTGTLKALPPSSIDIYTKRVLDLQLQIEKAQEDIKNINQGLYKKPNASINPGGEIRIISQAYAADTPTTPSRTKEIIVYIILAVIIGITIASFALLIVSTDADKLTFAKDTLKAAGGFYFGIINGVLGLG